MLEPLEYLQWYRSQGSIQYDLGGTDLRTHTREGRTLIPDPIADVQQPPDDVGISSILSDEYDLDATVSVASGARHAHLLGVMAALGRSDGDRVALVETPTFEPLFRTPEGFGARIDRFERPAPTFELDPDRIAAAITPETDLVTISNRHNPSGNLANRELLADVAEIVDAHDAILLCDEVYAPYTPDPGEGPFGGPTAAGLPSTAAIGSLTKFHGIGELRIGWLVHSEELNEPIGALNMHFPTVGAPNHVLGTRALYSDVLVNRARRLIRANHELLTDFMDEHRELEGIIHEGVTFGFIGHERASGNKLASVAKEEGILVIPGRFFGDPDRVRIGLGKEPEAMQHALELFENALERL